MRQILQRGLMGGVLFFTWQNVSGAPGLELSLEQWFAPSPEGITIESPKQVQLNQVIRGVKTIHTNRETMESFKSLLREELKQEFPGIDTASLEPMLEALVEDDFYILPEIPENGYPKELQVLIRAWNADAKLSRYSSKAKNFLLALNKRKGLDHFKTAAAGLLPQPSHKEMRDLKRKQFLSFAPFARKSETSARFLYHSLTFKRTDAMDLVFKESTQFGDWLGAMIRGVNYVHLAWDKRGSGLACEVTEDGWKGFHHDLIQAQNAFREAEKARPGLPETATEMVRLALVHKVSEGYEYWISELLRREIDSPRGIAMDTWFSRPRWGGSINGMKELAYTLIRQHKPGSSMALQGLDRINKAFLETGFYDAFAMMQPKDFPYQEMCKAFETMHKDGYRSDRGTDLWMLESGVALMAGDYVRAKDCLGKALANDPDAKRYYRQEMEGNDTQSSMSWMDIPRWVNAFTGANKGDFQKVMEQILIGDRRQAEVILDRLLRSDKTSEAEKDVALNMWMRGRMTGNDCWLGHGNGTFTFQFFYGNWGASHDAKNLDTIRQFIEYSKLAGQLDKPGMTGSTPFLAFCGKTKQKPIILDMLLDAGVNPSARDTTYGRTCVWSAMIAYNPELLDAILSKGIDPNVFDKEGYTALSYVPCMEIPDELQLNFAKILLKHGAKVDLAQKGKNPPLTIAADCHRVPLIKLLIEAGANPDTRDINDINIMDYGLIHKYQPLIDYCRSIHLKAAKTPDPQEKKIAP